jgi:copper resistance protein B
MRKQLFTILVASLLSNNVFAGGMEDDPVVGKVMIDRFEKRFTGGPDPVVLEADAWLGKDLDKFWVKVDAERVDGKTEELQLQALYSRAIDPYWDLQVGWRHDQKPTPRRDWLAIGFKGLAPYWYEVDTALFIGESGQANLYFQAEYEWMFTQKWVLSPEVEVNFYNKDDEQTGTGSGLSDLELGLRLRYELRREFAPYIGINWEKKFGHTADFARADGEDVEDTQIVAGIRAWF